MLGAQPPDAGVADAEATVPAVGLGSARHVVSVLSYGWYGTKESLVIQYDSNFLPQNLRGFGSKVCG